MEIEIGIISERLERVLRSYYGCIYYQRRDGTTFFRIKWYQFFIILSKTVNKMYWPISITRRISETLSLSRVIFRIKARIESNKFHSRIEWFKRESLTINFALKDRLVHESREKIRKPIAKINCPTKR